MFASDASAVGFVGIQPNALRYSGGGADPSESVGILRSFISPGVRVLDVGCGTGGATRSMTDGRTDRVVCIEPDLDRAEAARCRSLEVHSGVLDLPFVKNHGPFDAIVFGDVLEHMVDPAAALALARECLAPAGVVLVSVPNVAHWTIRLKLLLGAFEYAETGLMDATHLRWFTRKSLFAMLDRQGFLVVDAAASAGHWLPVYRRFPLCILPSRARKALVNALVKGFPALFGCQNVVRAVLKRESGA